MIKRRFPVIGGHRYHSVFNTQQESLKLLQSILLHLYLVCFDNDKKNILDFFLNYFQGKHSKLGAQVLVNEIKRTWKY